MVSAASNDDPIDVLAVLRADIALPSASDAPHLDAGFFHRSLARWSGLLATEPSVVEWHHPIWRADLEVLAVDGDRREYQATLYRRTKRGPTDDVEVVRYAVLEATHNGRTRILAATWLGAPPSFVGDSTPDDEGDDTADDAELARAQALGETDA
jgi:hypothetical protein